MTAHQAVLLIGGTGRTGQRSLEQLLARGVTVRAIVRSAYKLPRSARENPHLTVVEANLLSLSDEDLLRHVRGCDAIVSCLGHVISFKGIFGPPHDLVTRATTRLCRAIEALQPAAPVKFVLMSSVSVNDPAGVGVPRGMFERAFLWILRGVIPPARDNQAAASFLHERIGVNNPFIQWVAVRPDTLLDRNVSEYTLHEGPVSSVFAPRATNRASVAHFMCELVTNPKAWDAWKGKLPVILNATAGTR